MPLWRPSTAHKGAISTTLGITDVDDLVISCNKEAEERWLPPSEMDQQPYRIASYTFERNGEREIGKTIGVYWMKDEDILTFKPPADSITQELSDAEARWLREVQVKEFDIKPYSVEQMREFEPCSDQDGLLRMGGRLRRSTLPPESKHPIILPHNHPVTELLIKDHHVRQMHAGVNQTLVAIRTRFWFVRARNAAKKVIRSCPGRDTRVNKAYVCIFTCMTTRAVRLELLREQTTDSFLQGLRRFISRRGRPRVIQSDNFRSFKLADIFIQCLFRNSDGEKLQRKLNEERIRWKFITPRVPWCGGYWERLIRSIKNALRKTIRGALLKYDELHTVLCEIEARINDRPLVFMGDDISGEAALTPAHFLIGHELSRLPNLRTRIYRRDDITSGVNHLIRRWRYQQCLTAQLWKRWKQEYVTTLTTRGRWRKTQQEPRIHPSEDGVVRSATVQTKQGTGTRSDRSLRLVEPSGDA
ncbi:hypothetical protein T01_3028 [Trichinella spiralis]|uniref:Integrase catalytic domain-containing protein n=1 Tax=Trichinella spiralis TaxID=6334 RepID=A0A0V1BS35_TRISP|nr:hypothetical protein T01_3028 [Trichinella spiralis]